MNRLLTASALAIFIATASSGLAMAQEAGGQCDLGSFKSNMGFSEASGNWKAVNSQTGFLGMYQMGADSLTDAGLASGGTNGNIKWANGMSHAEGVEWFLGSPSTQNQAYDAWAKKNWGYMKPAHGLVGNYTLPNGEKLTASGLLQAGQFGQGRVNAFAANGGICNADTIDGNGVCVSEFMMRGNGFDVSSITGQPSDVDGQNCQQEPTQPETPWDGDTTSKTCIPTVPMLANINCAEYPASMQGFCYRYKPLMMDRGMCEAAEAWAESVPPAGPHLESCKTQTFGDGTSSWSYVHACAKAEPAMGATGQDNDKQTITGDPSDPACYQRLEARGVDFIQQGNMTLQSGGITCVIENSLLTKGSAIPLPSQTQMSCALAERLEDYGEAIKAFGVTGYTEVGTVNCRLMNTGGGKSNGLVSMHGRGLAIDIHGFIVGGRAINGSEWYTSATSKAWLENVKQVGCSIFDRTLAWTYYRATGETHIHFETGENGSCDPAKK